MEAKKERVFLLVCLLCAILVNPTTAAANLDTIGPILKTSPAGEGVDEFGYSVLLHRISTPVMNNFESFLNSTRLVVGAPRGTYPGGLTSLSSNAVNNTGLVYECPVGRGDCDRAGGADSPLFDGNGNDMFNGLPSENKTGQLMGSSLYSEGNNLIACAPLYVVLSQLGGDLDDSRPVGRCFHSTRDFMNFRPILPCPGTADVDPISTQGTNQQCLAGFSTTLLNANTPTSTLVVAAPGSLSFAGNLFLFESQSLSRTGRTMNVDGDEVISYQYEGFSTTIGDVTGINSQDVISGGPRLDGARLFGGVHVRPNSNVAGAPTITVNGTQTGEYFGAAVVAVDLNNDGYDEVVVGAPIYSSGRTQENGRVYVFRNMGGTLDNENPVILEGPSTQSRFGSSIVNLGDIDGDNLEDIAIGAPYEGYSDDSVVSGSVYIHYGRNSGNEIISTIANQVIRAQNVVDTITDVSTLRGFGFSLSGGVDVDGNEFNDLLVGAHMSGTAVLFRSQSVADVEIVNITTNDKSFQLDTIGVDGTPFTVRVCAQYRGRGFNNRPLTVNLGIGQASGESSRIFFNPVSKISSAIFEFTFDTTDSVNCKDIQAYGASLTDLSRRSDINSPVEIQVNFTSRPRPATNFASGSPLNLVDFRDFPIIRLQGNSTISVSPSVNCSDERNGEEVCISDLIVSLNSIIFLDSQDREIDSGIAVADQVQTVQIELTYDNIGADPALESFIQFTLPEGFMYTSARVPNGSQEVTCQESVPMSRTYSCLLANYIPPQNKRTNNNDNSRLTIVWTVNRILVGNEPSQTSTVLIGLVRDSADSESNIGNNELMNGPLTIMYGAVADLDVSALAFTVTAANYRFTEVPSNPTVSQIGRVVELQFVAINRGPSNSPTTRVELYIPTNDTVDRFYLYLANATAMLNDAPFMDCDFSGINPQNLMASNSNTRRRRSVVKRQEQASAETISSLPAVVRNCSDVNFRASGSCTRIVCDIQQFGISQRLDISVVAALDNRFFNTESAPFTFVAYGSVFSSSSFVSDPNEANNRNMTEPYQVTLFLPPERVVFPFWIIIVIGVVFVIFLILLFIFLYCIGCFRRKRRKDEFDDGQPTSTVKVTAISGNGVGEEKAPSGSPSSIKKEHFDEADDIGDASDLQVDEDGPEAPVKDPDETSL